jgi:amino acid adenylation domain-containing protein
MWISVLAVWKAGGAYVPLDPAYPAERLNYIAQDAGLEIVISQPELVQQFSYLNAIKHVLPLSTLTAVLAQQSLQNPDLALDPHHLAYMIYTSGSTGLPKGVMVEHRGLGNLAQAQAQAFQVTPDSRILQHASFSFDASVSECLMALCAGARLCLEPSMFSHGPGLLSLLEEKQITHLTTTPSLLQYQPAEPPISLPHLIVAGEACSGEVMAQWSKGRNFYNAYGPTEASVCATMTQGSPPLNSAKSAAPSIGTPIQNVQVYVLDHHQQLVPQGVTGELYIGGIGLARGYWNRPDLTAERFIEHPFVSGERLYRTSDRVRWRNDGQLDYLGRMDHQVKLRGFRIELTEIEAVLQAHADVHEAIALLREDETTGSNLVAYVVSDTPHLDIEGLRQHLSRQLPNYMMPAAIIPIAERPLTPNGKLDRQRLPIPDFRLLQANQPPYIAPRTPLEIEISQLWSTLLNVTPIGVEDNFFALGGHSLLAMQLLAQIKQQYQVEIPLQPLFEKPTLGQLADLILVEQMQGLDAELLESILAEVEQTSDSP